MPGLVSPASSEQGDGDPGCDERAGHRTDEIGRASTVASGRAHRDRIVGAPADHVLVELPTPLGPVCYALEIQAVLRALNTRLPTGCQRAAVMPEGPRTYCRTMGCGASATNPMISDGVAFSALATMSK